MLIISQAHQIACFPKEGEQAESLLINIIKSILKDFTAGKDMGWRETLRVFPHVLAVGGARMITSETGWDMATNDPWCAFYALQQNYRKFCAQLEDVVLWDGTATFHLMNWTMHQRRKRFFNIERYYKTLLTDPYWAWRTLQQTEDENFLNRLKRFIHRDMNIDPAAAFLWVLLSGGRDEDKQWEVAMSQANTLYYLSFLDAFHRHKHRVPDLEALTPKWACHLMLAPGLKEIHKPKWRKVLVKQPEWVAEYIVRSPNITWDEINALAMDCRNACTPSFVLERFGSFKKRYHQYHEKR